MNIEEMAENLYRVQYAACAGHAAEVALIATTIRECLAKSAGVELKTTAEEREVGKSFFKDVGGAVMLSDGALKLYADIDTLITALAARDAEIERLKQQLDLVGFTSKGSGQAGSIKDVIGTRPLPGKVGT